MQALGSFGLISPLWLHDPPARAEFPHCNFVLSLALSVLCPLPFLLFGLQTLQRHKAEWGVEDCRSRRLTGSLVSSAVKVRKGVFIIFDNWEGDQPVAFWRTPAQHFIPRIDYTEFLTIDF